MALAVPLSSLADQPQPQARLHRFQEGDEWNYKFTYTLYYTGAINGFPWPMHQKSALDVRFRVVKQEKEAVADRALLITVRGKTSGDAKVDVAGLVWIRQKEDGALEVIQPETPGSQNTKEATLLPGEWKDGLYFAMGWVGDWLADVCRVGVAAIRTGDLWETIGSVVVDGVDVVKTHAGKFVCWMGKRVRFGTGRQPTANTWYFAPEVGLPVRSVAEFPIDSTSHFAVTWDLESTNVVPPPARR
ncbi:MAG: hypothetical protein ACP5VE_03630 [Chthonomonadales bacterium]